MRGDGRTTDVKFVDNVYTVSAKPQKSSDEGDDAFYDGPFRVENTSTDTIQQVTVNAGWMQVLWNMGQVPQTIVPVTGMPADSTVYLTLDCVYTFEGDNLTNVTKTFAVHDYESLMAMPPTETSESIIIAEIKMDTDGCVSEVSQSHYGNIGYDCRLQ